MDKPAHPPEGEPTRRDDAGERCPFCGEPMADPNSAFCSHCARPVAPPGRGSLEAIPRTLTQPSVPADNDLGGPIPLRWGLRCTKCGYDLTGLVERRCPECGQPFRPRETWLANRRLVAGRGLSWPPVYWGLAIIGLPIAVRLMIAFPPLVLMALVWLLLEWACGRLGIDRTLLRIGFAAALVILLLLLLALP